jgi:hypothetical protein
MISRRDFDWEGSMFYPPQRTYLKTEVGREPIKVNYTAVAKGRKRGPKQGGATKRAQHALKKLAALGII